MIEWMKQQKARKAEIATRRAEWQVEKQWEVEKAAAKASTKKFSKKRPILEKLPAAILRPTMAATNDKSSNNDDDDDDGLNKSCVSVAGLSRKGTPPTVHAFARELLHRFH